MLDRRRVGEVEWGGSERSMDNMSWYFYNWSIIIGVVFPQTSFCNRPTAGYGYSCTEVLPLYTCDMRN